MTESLKEKQIIKEFTEGLTLEIFLDVMITANTITEAYRRLYPDAPKDQTYEEIWNSIKQLKST